MKKEKKYNKLYPYAVICAVCDYEGKFGTVAEMQYVAHAHKNDRHNIKGYFNDKKTKTSI